jgi:putative tryptophan/tyrosine transport system substrate-binding protein
VFYPESKEPYRSIYQEIVSGTLKANSVSDNTFNIEEFILTSAFDAEKIAQELREKGINRVIVLGRQGFKLAKKLPEQFNIVSGALPIAPNGISGISLISDPANLFDYLVQVAPQVKIIHLAYSTKSEWLIEHAKKAAIKRGLIINLKKVSSTKEAIEFYNNLFDSNISKKDAIWLPLDRISSHDKITLPIILEKAWTREIVVFSSKPSHAKRGVLFSTYPDNFALGKHLFEMVNKLAKKPKKIKFIPLTSMQLAVNLRTAAHLGIKYSAEQQQKFKLTFPQ